ncbi:DUF6518 family protein [Modestobacter sp. VKM Ac-2985]|uniref:DUF6518 family protein n=1 Tax=Modestobacter sp. VKM Ac-2985 TaxID=3004139 RepID=UPI0022AB646E|nr:DUF6518 family protein [Modestobacter sp. VKM Ac-2985]MCZ2836667.1 DUF6518 family protein [Modestobacter sp. VKM Ac-2985]
MTATTEATARRKAPLLLATAAGAVAGVAAKAGDESGWRWAADLGTYPAAWVLVVALIGWRAPTVPAAAARAGVFFAAMTVAYYAWAALVLDFGWSARLLVAWLLLSATAVPATGAAVHWATHRSGRLPGALLGVPAGLVLGSGAARQLWLQWVQPGLELPDRPVQVVAELVTAVVLVAVLPRDSRTRLWAGALAVPAVWLAPRALDLLQRFV